MPFGRSVALTLLILTLAACGSSSTSGGSSPGSSASATPSSTAAAVVRTNTVTVSGAQKTVLTNSDGFTLYYNSHDTATMVTCSGGCAGTWPPLTYSQGTPGSAGSLPGPLAIQTNANGAQVTYQGHPLYRYASDNAAGDANGDGKFGIWFAATPSLAPL